jgi:hypothetical protein
MPEKRGEANGKKSAGKRGRCCAIKFPDQDPRSGSAFKDWLAALAGTTHAKL